MNLRFKDILQFRLPLLYFRFVASTSVSRNNYEKQSQLPPTSQEVSQNAWSCLELGWAHEVGIRIFPEMKFFDSMFSLEELNILAPLTIKIVYV